MKKEGILQRWVREHKIEKKEILYTLKRLKKNPLSFFGFAIFTSYVFLAVSAPFIVPYDPQHQIFEEKLQPPSWSHFFGTDDLGRDVFSRLLYGARISLWIGVMVVILSAGVGSFIGIVSGYVGGWVDESFMRITDMFLSFPRLILAMAISAALGKSLETVMLAVAITGWPRYARLMRAQTLSVKEELFVEAAKSIGASKFRIIFFHILPNCLSPIIVQSSMRLASVVTTTAGLSFIGFGAQPPSPEWGLTISLGRTYLRSAWWMSVFPGLALLILILGANFFGDSLQDIFDPRIRRG